MAIDYALELNCIPRQQFGTLGIVERLKAGERAASVIRLFREAGDSRPPSEMGFEMARSLPDGTEETRVVIVQEMLDVAAELDGHGAHCQGCPANLHAPAFGCSGQVNYPISTTAEAWLLERLPGIDQPLVWLLLREGMQANGYDGEAARGLRGTPTYFEEKRVRGRDLVEFVISADQIFEMLFLVGSIQPAHAAILLLFFDAIPRSAIEAPDIVAMMNGTIPRETIEARFPFTLAEDAHDDRTIRELTAFLRTLHTAWRLGVQVAVDA